MEYSRRDCGLLLLTAASAAAQNTALASHGYGYETLPVKTSGANKSRAVLKGVTHSGTPLEMHITELGPHAAPHPPHHHIHEELVMIREGSLEVTMAGKTAVYGPGSVIYVASNDEHGWKNAGAGRAEYFVIALGGET